ncbi:rifin [Plasmodium falciparum IGH-CR14]|uniref:Rifin n=1 Tax=Plasmodium falciparum IGH-CR14 TaxID=580059 RepID=A0A0L1IBU2_PLAFA|nr:rifin [Plasmodium falciparum IGH-CR14]
MKLNYTKILLFFFSLNILVTLYHVNNQTNPYITSHHIATSTSRVLSECDLHTYIYDDDEDMKSVKENYDRQTSQRFDEYEERMKGKRQKRKEERDKNIQEIIEKDKMDKSLAEKVEKGCLRCGCGLGGVAAGVGIFGAIAVKGLENAALVSAAQKGIAAGIEEAIRGIKTGFSLNELGGVALEKLFTAETFKKNMFFVEKIVEEYNTMCKNGTVEESVFSLFSTRFKGREDLIIKSISTSANDIALKAGEAAKTVEEAGITLANTESTYLYSAIGYSVLAILIIVLILCELYILF